MSKISNYNVAVTHGNGKAGNVRFYQNGGNTYIAPQKNIKNIVLTRDEGRGSGDEDVDDDDDEGTGDKGLGSGDEGLGSWD